LAGIKGGFDRISKRIVHLTLPETFVEEE